MLTHVKTILQDGCAFVSLTYNKYLFWFLTSFSIFYFIFLCNVLLLILGMCSDTYRMRVFSSQESSQELTPSRTYDVTNVPNL